VLFMASIIFARPSGTWPCLRVNSAWVVAE
jgi:hypothetical protein